MCKDHGIAIHWKTSVSQFRAAAAVLPALSPQGPIPPFIPGLCCSYYFQHMCTQARAAALKIISTACTSTAYSMQLPWPPGSTSISTGPTTCLSSIRFSTVNRTAPCLSGQDHVYSVGPHLPCFFCRRSLNTHTLYFARSAAQCIAICPWHAWQQTISKRHTSICPRHLAHKLPLQVLHSYP